MCFDKKFIWNKKHPKGVRVLGGFFVSAPDADESMDHRFKEYAQEMIDATHECDYHEAHGEHFGMCLFGGICSYHEYCREDVEEKC